MKFLLILCICLLFTAASTYQQKLLSEGWFFKVKPSDPQWLPADTIPTTIHLDLLKNGKLFDPYFADNLQAATYLELENPIYYTSFDSDILTGNLVFEGLDTHCDVYLNQKLVLHADNMFRVWRIPNLSFKVTDNNLTVQFYSSPKYDLAQQKKLYDSSNFSLPANYSFSRKAAYQYGWDWGPRLVTAGIWNHVYIQNLETKISSVFIRNSKVTSQSQSATLQMEVEIDNIQKGVQYMVRAVVQSKQNSSNVFQKTISVSGSGQVVALLSNFRVAPVQLWFTHDFGFPALYDVKVDIIQIQSKKTLHSKQLKYGIRTVQVSQAKDAKGTEFTIVLNGIRTFMRGGNYIPPDMFMPRALKNPQVYRDTIEAALFARYNMIRVWGGGQFDYDIFYDLCDEKGLLIWHDLMFACAMYPGTTDFLENVKQEMVDNLKRLRNHPSIALWNGNNEVWIGWQQWGWQNNKTSAQKAMIEKWYDQIFRVTIGGVIAALDPDRFYWITSPSSSSNEVSTISSGDIHFWRVWGGGTPIEEYKSFVGRFNSQYGMQSAPDYFSILKFTRPEDRRVNSFVMRLHQRHIYGDKYLPMYTKDNVGESTDLFRYSYFTQIMQAYAVETAISSLRGGRPYCMGSLYWQLNDVWPVLSWAAVDYYGSYKAAQYKMRQSYSVYFSYFYYIDSGPTQGSYEYRVINDGRSRGFINYRYRIMNVQGTVLREKKAGIFIGNNSITVVSVISDMGSLVTNKNNTFIVCQLWNPDYTERLSYSIFYFVKPREIVAPVPQIEVKNLGPGFLSLRSNTLAKSVFIHTDTESVKASDNYMDLVPNEETIVKANTQVLNISVTEYFTERAKQMQFVTQ